MRIAEKVCKNCKYSVHTEMTFERKPKLGNCRKPGTTFVDSDGKLRGAIVKRHNDTCKAFAPKKGHA